MPMTLDLEPRLGYLHALMSGEYEHQQYCDGLKRIIDTAVERKLSKIMIDCLGLTGGPTIAERQELGTLLSERRFEALLTGKPTSHQIAHIANPPLRHPDSPAIAMANRRGGNSQMFANLDDALQWLGVETGKSQDGG